MRCNIVGNEGAEEKEDLFGEPTFQQSQALWADLGKHNKRPCMTDKKYDVSNMVRKWRTEVEKAEVTEEWWVTFAGTRKHKRFAISFSGRKQKHF